jgi:hypothetical protein
MDFAAILGRVQRLVLSPATEWDVIAGEDADMQRIYVNYVGPLIIAAAVATAIGISVFGISAGFVTFRVSAGSALTQAVVQIGLGLVGVYITSIVINVLAPQFGGTADAGQAFRLAAYAPTPYWVASILTIIPQLGIIALLIGLYSVYLLFVGLPKLMKPAEDKALVYTLAVIGVMIVISILIAAVSAAMLPSMTPIMRIN